MLDFKKIIIYAMFLATTMVSAQQLPQFTQYVYNTMSVNPAYAGSRETLNVTALHRNQWVGIDGNPTTSTFSAHSPVKFSRIGLGLTYINDQLGGENTNYVYGNFSYTVPLSQKVNMAFGLSAGATSYSLENPDPTDPFFNDGFSKWNPNIGAGVYVSSRMWYIGFSSPQIIKHRLK